MQVSRQVIPVDPRDLGLLPSGESPPQRPFAAVLGCADARVPIELIFNEGPNDLFVVRVAGNTLGEDVRGSLNYAIDHLGENLKLIAVLGHSGCGAVTAAVDVYLDPSGYFGLASKHAIRALVDRLLFIVEASAKKMVEVFGPDIQRHPNYREALIEVAVVSNAALSAQHAAARSRKAQCPRRVHRLRRLPAGRAHGLGAASRNGRGAGPRKPAGRSPGFRRIRRRGAALATHHEPDRSLITGVARLKRNIAFGVTDSGEALPLSLKRGLKRPAG